MSLKLIKGIDDFSGYDDQTVATIGTFDGLHLGHQAILRQLKRSAEKKGMNALAITFLCLHIKFASLIALIP